MAFIRNLMSSDKIGRKGLVRIFIFPFFIKRMDIFNFAIKNFADKFKGKNWLDRT